MVITESILDLTISIIIIILTFSAFYFPVKIYRNLLKYKEASLGLIFTRLDDSIIAFKIYAVAVLIFAIGRSLDLLNLFSTSAAIDNLATVLYLTTDILLIYSFYKLLVIIRIDSGVNSKLNET